MCHQRLEILCGELCPILCRCKITCIGEEWLWKVPWVLPPTPWNKSSLAVGVPLCPQCVVIGWRKSVEMQQQCARIFPAIQVDETKTNTGGDRIVVHYNLGDMELKERSLLSKCSVTTQSDLWRVPGVACYIPDPLGYSSNYVIGENVVCLVFVSRV